MQYLLIYSFFNHNTELLKKIVAFKCHSLPIFNKIYFIWFVGNVCSISKTLHLSSSFLILHYYEDSRYLCVCSDLSPKWQKLPFKCTINSKCTWHADLNESIEYVRWQCNFLSKCAVSYHKFAFPNYFY